MPESSWPTSGLDLKSDIMFIHNNIVLHDVAIVCADGVEIKACGSLLAARSIVFMKKLFGPDAPAKGLCKKIILDNIKSNALNVVIHYIHTETVEFTPLSPSFAIEAYHAASFFCLPRLMRMVLDHIRNIDDLNVASTLLNDAVAAMAPNKQNRVVFDTLLSPFCERILVMGDLNALSVKALEFLLEQTRSNARMIFNTPEHNLLVCVVDWAWSRSRRAPGDAERHARLQCLDDVKEPYEKPDKNANIRFLSKCNLLLLRRMMPHMDLVLVCPHRLRLIMANIDALTENSPQCMAFCHHACAGVKCLQGHPSGFRGKPRTKRLEWDRSQIGAGLVITEDGAVVEYLKTSPRGTFRTAKASTPFTTASEWDIVVESTDTYSFPVTGVSNLGLVGEAFDSFDEHLADSAQSWFLQPYFYNLGINKTQGALKIGDVATFRLNMDDRTCSLSINGHDCNVVMRNLPAKVYPAVGLGVGAKYRVRYHGP